jgi:hypothetical protein
MDGVADNSGVEASLVLLGAVVLALGVAGALRPQSMIRFKSEWARQLTRPLMRGRLIGGEVDPEDPLQRLITRVIGVMFVIFGISIVVGGVRGLT